MRTDKEGRAFAFHGSLLGAGALLGTLWGAIKFSGIDWATGSATHALLFNEAFAVALAACGVCWCAALAVRKPKAEGRAGLPLAACCAGTALVLLGSFVMGWCFLGAGVPLVAIVLAGACFGMGMLMLGFGWLAAYAAFEPATALVHAGLSFVLAGGLRYAFVTLDSAVASVAGVLALAVAAACALLGLSPQEAVGRGAGLSDTGLERKRRAVERSLEVNRPDPGDPVDILCKVGGLDIAAMTGFYLGCAAAQVPVILDGAISAAAALLAVRLCPNAEKALLPSHWPSEPCGQALLAALGLEPVLHGNFHLGEGTGAVALMPLLDMAQAVYRDMSTFGGMGIGAYRPDGEQVPAKVEPEAVP